MKRPRAPWYHFDGPTQWTAPEGDLFLQGRLKESCRPSRDRGVSNARRGFSRSPEPNPCVLDWDESRRCKGFDSLGHRRCFAPHPTICTVCERLVHWIGHDGSAWITLSMHSRPLDFRGSVCYPREYWRNERAFDYPDYQRRDEPQHDECWKSYGDACRPCAAPEASDG